MASETDGLVFLYRNENLWDTVPLASLTSINQTGFDLFQPLGLVADLGDTVRLLEIELADMDGDETPDLIASIMYKVNVGGVDIERGIIANYRAQTDPSGNFVAFQLLSYQDIELPVTGFTIADYNNDNLPDILASCVNAPNNPVNDPLRVFVLLNDTNGVPPGTLTRLADETFPTTFNPSANIVAGEFSRLTTGGLGGTGTTLDFISFGGEYTNLDPRGEIVLGRGSGSGTFNFILDSKHGVNCGFTDPLGVDPAYDIDGLDDGLFDATSGWPSEPSALVSFDPFANADQSLAATVNDHKIRLLHNRPRTGAFYHLCGPTEPADSYDTRPCASGLPSDVLVSVVPDVTSGNLNGDAFDDLVHINPGSQRATMLLGRGSPDAFNRILQFDCSNSAYYLPVYGGTSSGSVGDRVVCADMNLDGFDDILITRHAAYNTSTNPWTFSFVVYMNETAP